MIRTTLYTKLKKLLKAIATGLKAPNIMYDKEGNEPYLSRYYLIRGPKSKDGSHPFDEFGRPKENIVRTKGWSVVLHNFHKSDSTEKLHNHGWSWGLSFVLTGGYIEERLVGNKVVRKKIKPFSFNFILPKDFHRVELIEDEAWTLFFRGPRLKEWFYKDRHSLETIQWDKHLTLAAGGEK